MDIQSERTPSEMDFEEGASDKRNRKSLYRRISMHHFHVVKDQMSCCCCVPLGMGYHMIAAADVAIATIVTV